MKFFTYTFLISAVLMLSLVACSSEKTFENTQEVINALDKHNLTDCNKQILVSMIGANEGVGCYVSTNDANSIKFQVEIFTYDGNAKDILAFANPNLLLQFLCQNNDLCKDFTSTKLLYYSNVMIWILGEDAKVSIDNILSDLKD